jgi:hypothetical protein
MPSTIAALKQDVSGIGSIDRSCDKEDTLASSRQTCVLGVNDPPSDLALGATHITSVRPPFPCRFQWTVFTGQSSEKLTERFGVTEDIFDVLPCDVGRRDRVREVDEVQGELAAIIGETSILPGLAPRLAGR